MKRPLSVTIISWIYILAGAVGIAYHATELKAGSMQVDAILVLLVRGLAIVGGCFALRGKNWARWLVAFWMAFHVIMSAFHTAGGMITHTLFLAVIVYFLFRRDATAFFGARRVEDKV